MEHSDLSLFCLSKRLLKHFDKQMMLVVIGALMVNMIILITKQG